jgi:hypothetical protein
MWEISVVNILCLVTAGFALALVCACALFSRIAASQRGAIGCYVLGGVFCCLLAMLLLWLALA